MKHRPASQRAMMAKPTLKQIRAAYDMQRPDNAPVLETVRKKRDKITENAIPNFEECFECEGTGYEEEGGSFCEACDGNGWIDLDRR